MKRILTWAICILFVQTTGAQNFWSEELDDIASYRNFCETDNAIICVNSSSDNRIYRSMDEGDNFFLLTTFTFNHNTFIRTYSYGNRIYAVSGDRGSGGYQGVIVSDDHGQTWTAKNNGLGINTSVHEMHIFPNGNLLINTDAGVSTSDKTYISTDNGENWTYFESGTYDGLSLVNVISENEAYMDCTLGTFKSIDNGLTWTSFSGSVYMWTAYKANNGLYNITVGGTDSIFHLTSTDIINWDTVVPIDNDFPGTGSISPWTQIPLASDTIFISAQYKGVYYTPDFGQTWVEVNSGIPTPSLEELFLSKTGYLFVSVQWEGIYRSTSKFGPAYPKTTVTGLDEKKSDLSFQVYPVPANDRLEVKSTESNLSVQLYSVMGNSIHGTHTTDGNSLTIDLSSVPKGVYFIQAETDNSIGRKKIVVRH